MRFVLMVLMAALAGTASAKILENRGFESGDFAGWKTHGKGWKVQSKHSTEGMVAAQCAVMKGDEPGLRACAQLINHADIGKMISVSLDVSGIAVPLTPNSESRIMIVCVDANGKMIKEYQESIDNPKTQFQSVKLENAVVPHGTVEIYLMLVVEVTKTAIDGDWWNFDNINIQIH